MKTKETINVQGTEIKITSVKNEDYICLTDMAGYKDTMEARVVVSNWMSSRYTVDFLGIWEQINNPNFNCMEFHTVRNMPGRLVLTPKRWIELTNAIGIFSKTGRYGGGIFAHKDIAFEFGTWLSAEFKYLMIREFQRLKQDEQKALGWSAKRELAKINYHIHTSAIKRNLIPAELTAQQTSIIYASEADVLNVALFGITAKQWRCENPDKEGNMRDYASINELICLSNMENLNAVFINEGLPQRERLIKLNHIAIQQMRVLLEVENRKLLN
ncbi:MAG: KilA-N domain-containing protein [Bacteroidales bacterium]|nr:KilA-N domain-containing protein [Bacteroidales bacterium]